MTLETAANLISSEPNKAVEIYKKYIGKNDEKIIETCIYGLGNCYVAMKNAKELSELIGSCQKNLSSFPKARLQKIFRVLVDLFEGIPQSLDIQISIVQDTISWSINEKRFFLRQALETKLASFIFRF